MVDKLKIVIGRVIFLGVVRTPDHRTGEVGGRHVHGDYSHQQTLGQGTVGEELHLHPAVHHEEQLVESFREPNVSPLGGLQVILYSELIFSGEFCSTWNRGCGRHCQGGGVLGLTCSKLAQQCNQEIVTNYFIRPGGWPGSVRFRKPIKISSRSPSDLLPLRNIFRTFSGFLTHFHPSEFRMIRILAQS